MKSFYISLFLALVVTFVISCAPANPDNRTELNDKPQNVILMIGDGMGVTQVSAGMIAGGTLNLEKATTTGLVKTYSADDLITDSAAGATAMATGKKTKNGAISVDTSGNRLTTIMELAEDRGFNTGVIATSSITHATPAAFYAHNISRNDHESIAKDLVDSGIDFFMGGGKKYFNQRSDSINLLSALADNKFAIEELLPDDPGGFEKFGYFIADDAPVSYVSGRGNFLPEATERALSFFDQKDAPFLLMVEGSQIDWGGHANDLKYVITEMIDFDRAVGKAMAYADKHQNTLVIITADHETGGLAITEGDLKSRYVEGAFNTGSHTPVMVPLFAYGPGSEKFNGVMDNTEIFLRIKDLLDL